MISTEKIQIHNYNEAAFIMSLYPVPDVVKIAGILTIRAQVLVQNPNMLTKNTQPNGNS